MDGFLSFSPLETELVRSLARSCDLTLTIDISPATNDIHKLALELGAKDQPLPAKSRKPQISVTEARSLEREADEIARRIVELNRAGVPFRQIGVAIGDTGAYLALLRTTFDRFGIPARFYFSSPLRAHPVARFLGGLIDAPLPAGISKPPLKRFASIPNGAAPPTSTASISPFAKPCQAVRTLCLPCLKAIGSGTKSPRA